LSRSAEEIGSGTALRKERLRTESGRCMVGMAGDVRKLDGAAVEALGAELRGQVIGPESEEYDAARTVYNAMIDKRPALIARCADAGDVIAALKFSREQDLDVAIRGGGHSGGGLGLVDGGVTIDLSPMRWVRVGPDAGAAP